MSKVFMVAVLLIFIAFILVMNFFKVDESKFLDENCVAVPGVYARDYTKLTPVVLCGDVAILQ